MAGQQVQTFLNWERCSDLHNQLLDIGWAAFLREMNYEPETNSWWDHYFGEVDDESSEDEEGDGKRRTDDERGRNSPLAEELERRLHPDIIKFLKRARHDNPGTVASNHVFYYIHKIWEPQVMIQLLNSNNEIVQSNPQLQVAADRYVNLYCISDWEANGVMLDQETMKAVLLKGDDTYEIGYSLNGNSSCGTPLEDILTACLEMIGQKRVVAVELSYNFNNPEEPFEDWEWAEEEGEFFTPWVLGRDDSKIIEDTLTAWENLLSTIESRIPNFAGDEHRYYDAQHIEACDLHGFFLRGFIPKLRIPSFRFVAPGLRLASSEELADQPFLNFAAKMGLPERFGLKWYPMLLLRADRNFANPEGRGGTAQFLLRTEEPWRGAPELSAGLYVKPTTTIERCDGCLLQLPFSISDNGCARRGDGSIINGRNTHTALYQPGWNTIPEMQLVRLELLFKNWTTMVQNHAWQVDENGVMGGIEKFKEADTPSKWELYQIKRSW